MSECSVLTICIAVVLVSMFVCATVIWIALAKIKLQKQLHEERTKDAMKTEIELLCKQVLHRKEMCCNKCSFLTRKLEVD